MSELASFSECSRQTALQRFQLLRAHLEDGRSGREAAKKRGVRFGRPRKLALDQNELARRLVSEGKSVREIASVFNVHPATIYRLGAVGD
jgi:DNA invertase Pin-like site-specific DNA recombinase